jgi:hypothetical protein
MRVGQDNFPVLDTEFHAAMCIRGFFKRELAVDPYPNFSQFIKSDQLSEIVTCCHHNRCGIPLNETPFNEVM